MLLRQEMRLAFCLAWLRAGMRRLMRMAMMPIVTSISTKVNPLRRRMLVRIPILSDNTRAKTFWLQKSEEFILESSRGKAARGDGFFRKKLEPRYLGCHGVF